jgi:hypothetical protein
MGTRIDLDGGGRVMRNRRSLRIVLLMVAACTAVAGCVAPAAVPDRGRTYFGSSVSAGEWAARAYAAVDARGEPTSVGIRMSTTVLDELPYGSATFVLDLPEQAEATVFDHIMLNWNPHGHGPEMLFGKPHFDMHFYMTDESDLEEIDPAAADYADRAARLPDGKYVPSDYTIPPASLAPQVAVPFMGVHWIDETAGMTSGTYDFTQTFINGFWDGEYTFMEPMMTRDWLATRPTIREPIKQPEAYQHTAYYPTVYSVRFDDTTGEYDISLEEMVMHRQS